MTPKEKAKELFDKYMDLEPEYDWEINGINKSLAKQCALIVVEEFIGWSKVEEGEGDILRPTRKYWQDVKQEIEKL